LTLSIKQTKAKMGVWAWLKGWITCPAAGGPGFKSQYFFKKKKERKKKCWGEEGTEEQNVGW
jgi:hypothetical protein